MQTVPPSKLHDLFTASNIIVTRPAFLLDLFLKCGVEEESGIKYEPQTFSCLLEDVSQAFLEAVAEEKPHTKPFFSKTIRDLEVVEGSAARFDCKIEGQLELFSIDSKRIALVWAHGR